MELKGATRDKVEYFYLMMDEIRDFALHHPVSETLAYIMKRTGIEAELKTGRTHQIRVHLAHLGYPIAGDEKYGDFALNRTLAREGLRRMFLHAGKISLPHPQDGRDLVVEAALPAALTQFLQKLSAKEKQDYGGKV